MAEELTQEQRDALNEKKLQEARLELMGVRDPLVITEECDNSGLTPEQRDQIAENKLREARRLMGVSETPVPVVVHKSIAHQTERATVLQSHSAVDEYVKKVVGESHE